MHIREYADAANDSIIAMVARTIWKFIFRYSLCSFPQKLNQTNWEPNCQPLFKSKLMPNSVAGNLHALIAVYTGDFIIYIYIYNAIKFTSIKFIAKQMYL